MDIRKMCDEIISKLTLAERNLLLRGISTDNISGYDVKVAHILQKKHLVRIADSYNGTRIIVYTMKGRLVRARLEEIKSVGVVN
jgi:hypothetical protein